LEPVPPKSNDDSITIIAIGVLAFIVADFSHEALGHGIAILAVGAKPVLLTSCYFSSSGIFSRWIPAAGGVGNIVVGLLFFLASRIVRPRSQGALYFFVLAAAFNLFFASAYPFYSGIAMFGDWAAVISGLSPMLLWRVLLVTISVASYYVSLQLVAFAIRPFCGSAEPDALARLRRITLIPFVAALAAAGVAGAANPMGWKIIFTAGLPAAGAAFGLTQMDRFDRARHPDPSIPHAGPITRSFTWIVAAVIALAFFVGMLGPGIKFGA
jgi:hypothetical protein